MPLLLFIRHGLTDSTGKKLVGWTPNVHLSARGREQAAELATRLDGVKIDVLYSSPLERCRETAAPVASSKGLRPRIREGLGEVRYGDWQGKSLAQLSRTKLWEVVQRTPSAARFPNGESLLETQARGLAALDPILRDHAGETVAVCSHGDMIRLLLAHFLGVHIDLYQRIAVDTASVSAVYAEGRRRAILKLNDTGTLDRLGFGPSITSPPPKAAKKVGR